MLDFILEPIGWVMRQCYELTNHYAIALLLFSVFIQILLLPLGIKQQKNTIRQAMLRPKVLAIQKKYKGRTDKATQMKMQQ
ncbi:MAG TPA: YidC/Oxa1 family membrane protein insertase, partial [Bacillota bacterium]|nr:YidC/Oxa1 family membrane protein insertase [Bacillota bacterium]